MTGSSNALRLPGPLVLAPARQFAIKFGEARQQYPHLPDLDELMLELNRLTALGGVPAGLETSRQGKQWLRVYTSRASVGLYPSSRNDAWFVAFMDPIRLRDHGILSRGALRLAPQGWLFQAVLAQLPPGYHSFQPEIERAWRTVGQATRSHAGKPAIPEPATSAVYDRFCDDLYEVIEAGRQIDAAKQRHAPPIPYYAVDSAAEQRHNAAGTYVFRLVSPGAVERGTLVELRNAPDLRGTVHRIDGELLTVRFSGSVDRRRISEQGELIASLNPVVPRVQQDAVRALRDGAAVNPRLLPQLVEGVFASYRQLPDREVPSPAEQLDPDGQLTAFRRALAGPDMLLVLGPPGTGKTRTIVEIARACAARGERVLITSQTNTAVDNVLERLPDQVRGLRVGNDDRIATAVRSKTLTALAASLRQQILDKTSAASATLAPWAAEPGPAGVWLARLGQALGEAAQAHAYHEDAGHRWQQELRRLEAPFTPRLAALSTARDSARQARVDAGTRIGHLTTSLAAARRREHGLAGMLYRRVSARRAVRLGAAQRDADDAEHALATAEDDLARVHTDLDIATNQDPRVRVAGQAVQAAEAAIARTLDQAAQAAQALYRLLAAVIPVPAAPSHDPQSLAAFHTWVEQTQSLVRARAKLLGDWRSKLAEQGEDLHHELVRYADVVGATCIGVAIGRNLIADLEFDVAIIDEAGQISLPSTLVPLVRSRRAILVGDHRQLPPFVGDEVREWLTRRTGDEAIAPHRLISLLTTSAFERLYDLAPDTHRVLLRRQRRMPEAIADFVSAHFYEGRLTTGGTRSPAPPPFRQPLAIVDTSDLDGHTRAERERRRSETWQMAGCDNPAEAGLIIDLIQWYARTDRTWAVIVPYRAQVQLLTTRLAAMLGDETVVADNVGTVDAFQGGERDIICYGFTRSNPAGRIGFLAELRRINVAITRAKQQLVLVGDFTTLRAARDPHFRELAQALHRHAARHGEVHMSQMAADLLRDAWRAGS